jgi:CheY-like chemotaxis protein
VVDDEPDARDMMTSLLESCGATVTAAASVADALDALGHSVPDVMLADIAMPDRDGYDLIREVRRSSEPRLAAIPAAAVTACARDDERQRALTAGFQQHLAKPFQPEALTELVATLARTSGSGA